jgi:hypothetical protein
MLKWFMPLLLFCSIVKIAVPARPVARETWIISPDGRTASVTGQAIWKKLNPVWWFLNDDEPDPPDWQEAIYHQAALVVPAQSVAELR